MQRTNQLLTWISVMLVVITLNVIAFDGLLFYLALKIGKAASEGQLGS